MKNDITQVGRISFKGKTLFAMPHDSENLLILDGDFEKGFTKTANTAARASVKFLTPFDSNKYIGIGKNFPGGENEKNSSYPNFFIKTSNAIVPHLSVVKLPEIFGATVIEGEFGVVISKACKDIKESEVQDYILGYVPTCDLSGRDFVDGDENAPVAVKKSCDGFAPVGPFINLDTTIRFFDINTFVDDVQKQQGNSSEMIYSIEKCVSYISSLYTLNRFDIISMGTPNPKPKVNRDQNIKVNISGMEELTFTII